MYYEREDRCSILLSIVERPFMTPRYNGKII